jgi:phosphatidyl-myo-inositol dimannoside synthase
LGELAGRLDVPTFTFIYGWEAGLAQFGLGPLLRRVARGLDGVGVISEFTRHAVAPWMAEHTRLYEIQPGVDTAVFTPDADGSAVRERHGIAPDEPLVVCVSRLVPRKGQDALVEAWPSVRSRVPGARLLLVGTGPFEDRLRARPAALGLDPTAVLFAGAVPWSELPAHYVAADLFAMPCRTRLGGLDVEGLGIVYLEAQACGVPVVAGLSGGAPESVIPGETGLVVHGGAVPEVATAIADLLRDPDRLAAMGKAGRAHVEAHHSWDTVAARLEGLLEQLAGQPRKRNRP